MKQNLLLFIFLLIFNGLSAQIEVELPNTENNIMSFNLAASGSKSFGFKITNKGSEEVNWYWQIEKADNFPSDYRLQLCDSNNCYLNATKSSKPNRLSAGSSTNPQVTYLKILASGTPAASHIVFKIYDNKDFKNPVFVSSVPTSSVEVSADAAISIYPNPTQGALNIENDENVEKISIFNIVGKEVATMLHAKGYNHDISYLRSGMYLVRLFDSKGNVIKTSRLSKR